MPKHFSEADLLETYYMQPGASMPVMMHLAECGDCAGRYERLEKKLRALSSCETGQPETFWSRQRLSILRRVETQRKQTVTSSRMLRVAAAVTLAFALGGFVTWRTLDDSPAALTQTIAAATAADTAAVTASTDTSVPQDLWETDELDDFHSLVAWESWQDTPPLSGEKKL